MLVEGVSGQEGSPPPQKGIGRQEERAERVKNEYVTISDIAYVLEGSLSEVGIPPTHNL